MSICPSNEFSNEHEDAVILLVQRIEVFVVPALAVDANGFRVILRISSSRGYGWSEIFVDDSDIGLDLQDWEQELAPFIGPFSIHTLTDHISSSLHKSTFQDQRAYYLFTNALHQLNFLPDSSTPNELDEELILRRRSVAYLSLY